jgi:hypothetical protein
VQQQIAPATSALPGIETEERVDLLLQISLAKNAKEPFAAAVPAANTALDIQFFYEISGQTPICGSFMLHVVTPE